MRYFKNYNLIEKINVAFLFLLVYSFSSIFCQDFQKYNEVKPIPKEARWYEKLANNFVKCKLCPWECTIGNSQRGVCRARENRKGILYALTYARPCSIAVDPIEKKPFFHFLPGAQAFSLATAGCNAGCKFCQNWQISKITPEESDAFYISPEEMVRLAKRSGAECIAYTYSEPTVFYEYMIDISSAAKKEGLKNVVISCGYINQEPLKELLKFVNAYKVDLKGFTGKYYEEVVGAKLAPVLETIKTVKKSGVHLEIVYLVVPALNDNPEEIQNMCRWLVENGCADVPLHFSRFYPQYKMQNYPSTPVKTVETLREIAINAGMKYVYTGNVPPGNEGENTYCPKCKKLIIDRLGYEITENNIVNGKCKFCGYKINGRFQ